MAMALATTFGTVTLEDDRRIISNIVHLPNEQLANVATFLPKPSRALFAVAMTNPTLFSHKSLWESATSATTNRIILSLRSPNNHDDDDDDDSHMAVDDDGDEEKEEVFGDSDNDSNYNSDGGDVHIHIGREDFLESDDDYYFYHESDDETFGYDDVDDADPDYVSFIKDMELQDDDDDDDEWTTLDFEDIEETLAAKLSDDDIRGVLICIDGVNRLHTIRLCGCVNITGSGLDPLMGSTMLRTIDLSLAKDRDSASYVIEPKPKLIEESVIPILRSIIDAAGSSLRDVVIPHKFLQIVGHPNRFVDKYYGMADHLDLLRRLRSTRN
jgi:hypothetical protein